MKYTEEEAEALLELMEVKIVWREDGMMESHNNDCAVLLPTNGNRREALTESIKYYAK